ncbi:hypothetical protein [Streptosporangium canum]|uniref:hypothetical protein n=1 Tax=Streptosporangium canum TaxID=324952 RepID=UPI0037919D03
MDHLTRITQLGTVRRSAASALEQQAIPLRAAHLAAKKAGATPGEITEAGHRVVSRQAIDQYIAKQGKDAAETAWREAGTPNKYQALAAVAAASTHYKPQLVALEKAIAELAWAMRDALNVGISPTAVAQASGFANKPAWNYIAAIRLEQDVRHALLNAGLMEQPTSDHDLEDLVLVGRHRTVVKVTVRGREDTWSRGLSAISKEDKDIAQAVVDALAAIGASIGPEQLERLSKGASTIVRRGQEPDAAT